MEIIGWIFLAVILFKASLVYMFIMFNGLGQYNIGGVHNSLKKKLTIVLGALIIGYFWCLLLQHSPFTISLK